MRRWLILGLPFWAACSSSDFSVGSATDSAATDSSTDTGVPLDGDLDASDAPVRDSVADGVVDAPIGVDGGPGCTAVGPTSTAIYVDAAAPAGGTGAPGCPVRTLAEAAAIPLGAVDRVVNVHAGSYGELVPIHVRPREAYRSDGTGAVKVAGKGTIGCGVTTGDSCTFQVDAGSMLDGLTIEGGTAAYGIVTSSVVGTSQPTIRATTVRNMNKDGIVVLASGLRVQADSHVDANAWSGVMVRAGRLDVSGTNITFDNNKGGFYLGSTYVQGSGIHVLSGGGLFVDGGVSASGNQAGVVFDAGGGGGTQTLSQLNASGNRSVGVFVAKGWQVTVRKSIVLKNGNFGLFVSFDGSTSIDLGPTGTAGGNQFGGSSTKNGRAAIFFCKSRKTGTHQADGNSWGNCPPSQLAVANCDTLPSSYADVAYVPEVSAVEYANPLASPTSCSVPP